MGVRMMISKTVLTAVAFVLVIPATGCGTGEEAVDTTPNSTAGTPSASATLAVVSSTTDDEGMKRSESFQLDARDALAVHYEIERISADYTPLVIVALWDSDAPIKVDETPLEGGGEGVVTFSAPYAGKYFLKVSGINAVYTVTAVRE
jgi:hypothetical protein